MGGAYCQHLNGYYLNQEGRVDTKIQYEIATGVISILFANSNYANTFTFLLADGRIIFKRNLLDGVRLLSGNPSLYTTEISSPVIEPNTKRTLSKYYIECSQYWKDRLKTLPWKQRNLKNSIKMQIDEAERRLNCTNQI